MPYFTKSEARELARRSTLQFSDRALRESVSAARDTDRFDIFLSHSSKDADLVRGVKLILEGLGFTVYVDWATDPQLDRANVTKATAALLRKRMGQCNSLLFAATENAPSSKWMPWELGYFDGLKLGNVAVMPLTDRPDETFRGQEYLGLYPIMRKGLRVDRKNEIFIEEVGERWTTLGRFAKGIPAWAAYG